MTETLEWCVVIWDFAGAPAADKSTNWNTVAVALISGLIGIGGSWMALGWQALRESRSVRAAIVAEVEALIELAQRRRYTHQLSQTIPKSTLDDWKNYRVAHRVRLGIPEHYNRVYLANASKLGVLSEKDARGVVRFYQLIDSLRADTSEGGCLYEGSNDTKAFQLALDTLNVALGIGKSLIAR